MRKVVFHLNCLERGGAERVVSNLANQFAKEDYQVFVATEWQGENEFVLEDKINRVHVGLKKADEGKSRISKIFLRIKYLRQFLKAENPDVVIAFAQKANYRALYATIGMDLPVIISVRTDPVGNYDTLADKIQIPLLFPKAAGCVFQTEGQKEFFPKYLQEKSKIILNPLNPKYLNVPKPERREKVIVQSGRLVGMKNQPMLIRAFLKVHEKHDDYVLKIYGGGSEDGTKEKLEELIHQNRAEDYIKLMGSSDRLEEELVNAAAFAFTSDWEGLPNALMEAMALGLPIISTDCPCGGPRTLIENEKSGLLIPVKDEEALAAGMNRLIEDPVLAEGLGENARRICEKVNAESIIEQWREYIEKIIASNR